MDRAVEQLMLIGGTALLYSTGAVVEQRQAAFDSILYAQLVANKNAGSRFADYEHWYSAYRDAYRQLGWIRLASTHDLKQLGQPVRSAQIQPLEAWLKMRSIRHETVLAAIKAGLGRSEAGLPHLLKFGALDQAQGSKLVIEFGILKPGPVLDLCCITMQTGKPLSGVSLDGLLGKQVLQGEAEFNGISLALDNGRFQRQREELQALMNAKDGQGDYRFDPYAAPAGAHHE
ncbi:MAG: hypothetical protein P0Y58_05345 [Candidatus Pseudomonas phytovorans]|uniref:Uncharacterized protein n=1 Tax=Candidatus Pseudomonas phytovorans TaxID=3121377 RepID=A0AAJ6BDD0_9PSED|nr:hypothetical protein [Pseudomonas sp.]WEK31624.1 MAG: hypothetical protein P0Y58_05345 [Pseudomonas sp.]